MNGSPLERALAHPDVKTQAALSEIIGVSQQAISLRLKSGRPIPAEWAVKLEEKLGIPRHESRPDLYPPPADKAKAA